MIVIAFAFYAVIIGEGLSLIEQFLPNISSTKYILNKITKLSTALVLLSISIFLSSDYPKIAKSSVLTSSLITAVFYVLNSYEKGILLSYLVLQSLILIGITRKKVIPYFTGRYDAQKKLCMIFIVIIVSGQMLWSLVADSTDYGSLEFRITPFYICYQDLGFVQRGLWGTIYRFLFGTFIPENVFYTSYHLFYIAFYLIFMLVIALFVKQSKNETEKNIAIFFAFIFLISPGYNKFFFELTNYIIAWICVLLAYRNKHSVMLIPLLCGLAMLTHQIFASIIFPIVFISLVYRTFINSDGHSVRNISCIIITLIVVGGGFLYLTYFNAGRIDMTYEQIRDMIDQRSGGFFPPHENMIKYVYLDKEHVHSDTFMNQIESSQIENAKKVFFVNLPALVVYIYSFFHSARLEKSIPKKLAYIAASLSVLAIVPAFIVETDYGRWCSQYVSILILAPLILTLYQPKEKKWYKDIDKKKLYIAAALLIFSVIIQPNYPQLLYVYSLKIR